MPKFIFSSSDLENFTNILGIMLKIRIRFGGGSVTLKNLEICCWLVCNMVGEDLESTRFNRLKTWYYSKERPWGLWTWPSTTSIQLRLVDDTRIIACFNTHHLISDVRASIDMSSSGVTRTYAKIFGALICIAGTVCIFLYKGSKFHDIKI